MKTSHSQTSVCRRCRYYEPEGRRGGHCQQLNVAVQGAWSACALAIPLFSPTWENFEDIMLWQQKTLAAMEESALVDSLELDSLEPTVCTDETAPVSKTLSDRVPSEQSLSGTSPHRSAQPQAEPKQTIGIKALWM